MKFRTIWMLWMHKFSPIVVANTSRFHNRRFHIAIESNAFTVLASMRNEAIKFIFKQISIELTSSSLTFWCDMPFSLGLTRSYHNQTEKYELKQSFISFVSFSQFISQLLFCASENKEKKNKLKFRLVVVSLVSRRAYCILYAFCVCMNWILFTDSNKTKWKKIDQNETARLVVDTISSIVRQNNKMNVRRSKIDLNCPTNALTHINREKRSEINEFEFGRCRSIDRRLIFQSSHTSIQIFTFDKRNRVLQLPFALFFTKRKIDSNTLWRVQCVIFVMTTTTSVGGVCWLVISKLFLNKHKRR